VRRIAVVLVVLLAAACGSEDEPRNVPPARLVDLVPGSIDRIEVEEPGTGRIGGGVPGAELADDLTPLLAVRELDGRRPAYGLDPPRLVATIHAGGRSVRLLVGGPNFDDTAVYVAVGRRTALVLPRVVDGLEALLDG